MNLPRSSVTERTVAERYRPTAAAPTATTPTPTAMPMNRRRDNAGVAAASAGGVVSCCGSSGGAPDPGVDRDAGLSVTGLRTSNRNTISPATTPNIVGTTNHPVAAGRCSAATPIATPSTTNNALPIRHRRSSTPLSAARISITIPIEANSTSLSWVPKRRIAASRSPCGVWSTTVDPATKNGEASGSMSAATSSPMPSTAAPARTPARAAAASPDRPWLHACASCAGCPVSVSVSAMSPRFHPGRVRNSCHRPVRTARTHLGCARSAGMDRPGQASPPANSSACCRSGWSSERASPRQARR